MRLLATYNTIACMIRAHFSVAAYSYAVARFLPAAAATLHGNAYWSPSAYRQLIDDLEMAE